jgi:hypothetical protein
MPHRAQALLQLITVAVFFVLGASAAQAGAIVYGSAAWTTDHDLALYEGPSMRYDIIGSVSAETQVRVERCKERWCFIRGDRGDGWVSISVLSFGEEPRSFLELPKQRYPGGGPGIACFYTDINFTGVGYCAEPGTAIFDLLLEDMDNRFASLAIEGSLSVTVCRDADFSSYCERVVESQPILDRFLVNAVSSFYVH